MSRLVISQIIVVEGKYDAIALSSIVDGLIITTDGFSIFTNDEKKALLKELGKKRGIVILTDSDKAGFAIRHYVEKIAGDAPLYHAYIPAVAGKEKRKTLGSKEGTLGVEGMPAHVLRTALEQAGVYPTDKKPQGRQITYTDLFNWGLSGTANSAAYRRKVLHSLGLPVRLSKKALCQVLNSFYTYEEFEKVLKEKPVLFWDFHGTLSLPDLVWFDVAMEAAAELVPEKPLAYETLVKYFTGSCLPWYSIPSRDTRHVTGDSWWRHSEAEFEKMLVQCGFTLSQAAVIAPAMRPKVLQAQRYHLYDDTLPTLRTLQKRGYTSYILSNNFPELDDIVVELGLQPYIAKTIVSGKVGYDKPRKEIFEIALKTADNPALAWMIGDNPQDDIAGGNAAGFTTVLVHNQSDAAAHAVNTIADCLQLLP